MKKVLVYGAAEFGQIVRNLVKNCSHNFAGFIDDFRKDDYLSYEQCKEKYSSWDYCIVIAVGYKSLKTRWDIYQKVKADGYKVPNLVHPKAIVDKSAKIGEGVIIMAGAIVDYNAEIKDLAVLWNGAVVSHDSVIGENTFLSPNCTICGGTKVGSDCFIGVGSIITEHLTIPDGSFVKAGDVNNWKPRKE